MVNVSHHVERCNQENIKKILVAFGLLLSVSSVFAIDCGDMDEKLVILDNASKLDTNMYDEKGAHNKINLVDYKLVDDSYTGRRATYKLENARCVIDNKFVHAKSILIFDDMAEIQILGGGSIVFKREENNKLFDYVGKYQYDTIYLRLKNKQIFVGRNKYSAKECL